MILVLKKETSKAQTTEVADLHGNCRSKGFRKKIHSKRKPPPEISIRK